MLCMTKTNNIDYRMYNAYVFIHIIYISACGAATDRLSAVGLAFRAHHSRKSIFQLLKR